MFERFFRAGLLTIAASVFFCGCSSNEPVADEDFGKLKVKPPKKIVYEIIPSRGCRLETPHDVNAVSGSAQEIEVRLINNGWKELRIKEWYMLDNYNFAVYYRRLPSDRPLDPKTPFKKFVPHITRKSQPRHAELRLARGNQAVLNVLLPFVGDLNPGEMATFEVYLATNLNTFKLRSSRFMVYAR